LELIAHGEMVVRAPFSWEQTPGEQIHAIRQAKSTGQAASGALRTVKQTVFLDPEARVSTTFGT
jgi:hypothetical protein